MPANFHALIPAMLQEVLPRQASSTQAFAPACCAFVFGKLGLFEQGGAFLLTQSQPPVYSPFGKQVPEYASLQPADMRINTGSSCPPTMDQDMEASGCGQSTSRPHINTLAC